MKRTHWFKSPAAFLACLLLLMVPSCQKDQRDQELFNMQKVNITTMEINSPADLIFGPKTYTIFSKPAVVVTELLLLNPDFNCFYSDFVLNIQNGSDKKTRVPSAEISIDGVLIAGPSDFSKNVSFVTKQLVGLTSNSLLEVKLNGSKGCFLSISIEGTTNSEVITDADGNSYKTINIGTQTWMAENLKTTKYSNGELIGTTDPATLDIYNEVSPEYQWAYDGDENNAATYGRLYTWWVVTDSRNICPSGWHIPSEAEWTTLMDYLSDNGYGFEGDGTKIAKSLAATSGWSTYSAAGNTGNDQASNNSSCFTGIPSGIRGADGPFISLGRSTQWRSSGRSVYMSYDNSEINFGTDTPSGIEFNSRSGHSVRCLKDSN